MIAFSVPANKTSHFKMPSVIEKRVRRQNIEYMHSKNQYSLEYFQFMRRLLMANAQHVQISQTQDKLVGWMLGWCVCVCGGGGSRPVFTY